MAFVKFINTGQSFSVDEHESILEAAIRNGIPLDYGCSTGNCGRCKAKVLTGSVQPCKSFEHVLSEAEKLQGYALMCSHTCDSDIEIQADQVIGHQDNPATEIDVKVKRVRELQKEVASLTVQTPRTQRLRFAAGQYVKLTQAEHSQAALIASCPCDDRLVEFHFRLVADDPFVEQVLQVIKPGVSLTLDGPYGTPGCEQFKENQPLIMIAYDTGFAAAKSVIEHLFSQESEQAIHLIRLSCQEKSYLDNLCRSWADAFEQFSYSTCTMPEGNESEEGVLEQDFSTMQIASILEPLDPCLVACYVVAPALMLTSIEEHLLKNGVKANNIQLEPIRGELYAHCNRWKQYRV